MAEQSGAGHVVLVGMMGSGKTTVGRRVATALGVDFIDTDSELVASTGRDIAAWFSEVGEQGFRDVEAEVVARVLDAPATRVVATGGGAVLADTTRIRLCDPRHTVVWLRAGPAFLASRLAHRKGGGKRPLLGGDPAAAMARLDGERRALYAEVADVVIDVEPVMGAGEHPRRRLAAIIVDVLERTGLQVQR